MTALPGKSRPSILLERCSTINDPRNVRRIMHPLAVLLLLVVCGTIADCDSYHDIAVWGESHLDFLQRHGLCTDGVLGGRWLMTLMNRIVPVLFEAVFTGWVRDTSPERPEFVTIDS